MSRIRESIHNKMELGTSFYNYLVSKISKIALFGLGEFFYFNKLPTRLFSWNISVFKVSECRILYFLRLFITKYFMTIHTYQIMIFSLVHLDEPVCKFYTLKQQNVKNQPTSVHSAMLKCPLKNFAIKFVISLSNMECKYRNIRNQQ